MNSIAAQHGRDAPPEASSSPTVARFVDIEKTYDGRSKVIDRLNLDIRRGEFLTLLGPSGSGKTTCLMMLAGFEPWTAGDIEFNGWSLRNVPPYRRGIGMVFQNYALFPHMSVAQNVAFPLRQRGRPREEIAERVGRALDMVQLGAFGARRPSQLSGGQQQRVALARALVFEPELVLMDEPLGALDKRLRDHMQIELRQLHERIGMTVVYVTHDQGEALVMSDRIAVFNHGRIEQLGKPDEVYERPATAFVASFLGESNWLQGMVRERSGPSCTVAMNDGTLLRATTTSGLNVGDAVAVSVRPELLHLDPPAGPADNVLAATIREITYFGDHAVLTCALPQGASIDVNVPLTAHRISGLGQGANVMLGWSPADCWAFPAEDAARARGR